MLREILKYLNEKNGFKAINSEKKDNFFYPCVSKILFNILSLVFLFVGRNLYIKSLKGCDGDEFKCILNTDMKYILDDIYYCTHSVIYFLCFLFLFHLKLCSFYQIFVFLLIILELIHKDTGDSFLHHGILNLSAFFILMILGELFILIIILILNLYKNKKYTQLIQLLIIMKLLSVLIYIIYYFSYQFSYMIFL